MCLAQEPQRSDAGEALTRGLSVSSQALYHWATALPKKFILIVWPHFVTEDSVQNLNWNVYLGSLQLFM